MSYTGHRNHTPCLQAGTKSIELKLCGIFHSNKKYFKKFAQPNNCAYVCNQIVANNLNMEIRRDIFQAIADPTRRAIIGLIAIQSMTPNALAEYFHTSRQAVSKHIKILTECELVKQEQQGREIYYSLEIEKMKEIDKWLEQFRKIWETRFNQLDKLLSTMKKQKK
jgi:DNA-binding transcriptional ArsR family regulator